MAWEKVGDTPWGLRNGSHAISFKDKLWILGGFSGTESSNDVWNTENGTSWQEVTKNAAWDVRAAGAAVVFKDKMWILGGYGIKGTKDYTYNDAWYSSDGINWTCAVQSAPWCIRYGHTAVVFEDKIWVIGGLKGFTRSNSLNDVWCSGDGITWQEQKDTKWCERDAHTSVVYKNKVMVIGGQSWVNKRGVENYNDVWYYEGKTSTNEINKTNAGSTLLKVTHENSSVKIEYNISNNETVELAIYDSRGHIIKKLFKSNNRSGTHSLIWNRQNNTDNDIAPGVYFIRLNTNYFSKSCKVIIDR